MKSSVTYKACCCHLPAVVVIETIVEEGNRDDVGDMGDAEVDRDDRTTMKNIVLSIGMMVES